MPTALYRLYDGETALLYIGISENPPARFKQHARLQPWWFQVRSHTIQWLESRLDAEEAEKRAIETETPRWNREHMPPDKIRRDYPQRPPRVNPEAEALARIADLRDQFDAVRADLFAEIRAAFPETRGDPPVRGRLAEVTKASRWTREHVANIRDGKVAADKH